MKTSPEKQFYLGNWLFDKCKHILNSRGKVSVGISVLAQQCSCKKKKKEKKEKRKKKTKHSKCDEVNTNNRY